MFKRYYKDVNGNARILTFLEKPARVLDSWYSGAGFSEVELWTDEGGKVLQIPSEAWRVLGISFYDLKGEE
jgi:hypothetical protein